jgi:hypothetical protein
MSSRTVAMLLGLMFLLTLGWLSRVFPPVHTDEAFIAVHAVNLLAGQGQRYSLYDDIFAPSVYGARDAFGQVSLTLTNAWFGGWARLFSKSYENIRRASVIAGFLSLLIFYFIGKRWGGASLGVILIFLLMSDPVFLTSSCLIRPEILLLMFGTLVLLISLIIPETFHWRGFVVGVLSGLLMSVHPNSMPFWIGLFVFLWLSSEPPNRLRQGATFVLGILAGLVVVAATVELPKYLISYKLMFYELYKPPLLSYPWVPWIWVYRTGRAMLSGETAYFDANLAAGWRSGIQLHWVGFGICMAGGLVGRKSHQTWQRWQIALFGGLIASFVGMAVLISRKEINYSLLLYPFMIPLIGGIVQADRHPIHPRTYHILESIGIVCLTIGLYRFGVFVQGYRRTFLPLNHVVSEVELRLPRTHLKVVGPDVLWFSRDENDFRDIGALMYSHWYTGGELNLKDWLGRWRPDILIFDDPIKHLLFRNDPLPTRLATLMNKPIVYLGTVETGRGAYGAFEIYQVKWDGHTKYNIRNP